MLCEKSVETDTCLLLPASFL